MIDYDGTEVWKEKRSRIPRRTTMTRRERFKLHHATWCWGATDFDGRFGITDCAWTKRGARRAARQAQIRLQTMLSDNQETP